MTNRHPQPQIDEIDRAAVVVAGHRGDIVTVDAGCSSPDPAVRAAAIGALRRQERLSIDQLVAFLDDPEMRVRRRAADEAARIATDSGGELGPHDALIARLITALGDEADVAERAAFALGEFAGRATSAETALSATVIEHDEALVREAAVAALGAIGVGLETILTALEDRATVRRRAVIALAPFDDDRVEAALRRALEDRDWQVRQAAEDLLSDDPGGA